MKWKVIVIGLAVSRKESPDCPVVKEKKGMECMRAASFNVSGMMDGAKGLS